MKTALIVLGTIALAIILIGAGIMVGAALFGGQWFAGNTPAWGHWGPGMMFDRGNEALRPGGCTGGFVGPGEGVTAPCVGEYAFPLGGGTEITLEDAATAVDRYVELTTRFPDSRFAAEGRRRLSTARQHAALKATDTHDGR